VVALAIQARAHNLLLTHHDPARRDSEVEEIIDLSRRLAAGHKQPHYIDAAREGACYRLP
jgi:hypothetical protein